MSVDLYTGAQSPVSEIIEFLNTLEFSPAQHDPRLAGVFSSLPKEDFHVLVARDGTRIVAVSTFTIFHGPFGPILHANPYIGYGGCSSLPARQAEAVVTLMHALLDQAREHRCLTASVATPPFSEAATDLYVQALEPTYRFENFYQYHYLDGHPLDQLRGKGRQTLKRKLRDAESTGMRIVRAANLAQVEAWMNIYAERYVDIGASSLPRKFHEMLWRTFAPCGRARIDLAYLEDELLGGTLFLEGVGVVDYFSSAFRTESMRLHPAILLLCRAFDDFIARGIRRFNWQSSPSHDGGVYEFKRRWGALEGKHYILTKVLGDERVFISRPLEEVRKAYALHFVLPYDLWKS